MPSPSLIELLPDEDYRFYLRLQQAPPGDFFRATDDHEKIIHERRQVLGLARESHLLTEPEGAPLLSEAIALGRAWGTLPAASDTAGLDSPDLATRGRKLGELWEPDYLLLKLDAAGDF